MIVVDSSGWLEYFAAGPRADHFAPAIESPSRLVVPAITLYEVFKKFCSTRGKYDALRAVAQMQQSQVVPVSSEIALHAATLSLEHRLPMADSLILATAQLHDAEIWTMDGDFASLPGVRYFKN